jgi:hypothetical protein
MANKMNEDNIDCDNIDCDNIDCIVEYYSECPKCGNSSENCHCYGEKQDNNSFSTKLEKLFNSANYNSCDYILACYLRNCLTNFKEAINRRDKLHGFWYPEHDLF